MAVKLLVVDDEKVFRIISKQWGLWAKVNTNWLEKQGVRMRLLICLPKRS